MSLIRFLAREVVDVPKCKAHPSANAAGKCASCLLPVCNVCLVADGPVARCPQCIKRGRRARVMWTSLGLAASLAVVTGSFLLRRAVTRPSEAASLRLPERIKSALEEAMDGEPCDRAKMYDFAKELLKNGEPRVLIDRANAFLSRCGEEPRIRLQIYFAHGNLSDWDAAAADMTQLIEGDPNDSRYWSWRGLAYEKKGDLPHAAADFRQAMAIKPSVTGIPFNLARVYERMHTPCEGIGPLEQFRFYNPTAHTDTTAAQLERLYSMDGCIEVAGGGHAVIRFPTGSKVIMTDASIEGHSGKFVVDTGASYVALTPSFVKASGIVTGGWPTTFVSTAAGVKKFRVGAVSTIEVQGAKAGHIEACVIDDMPGVQGLLGESFLSRFVIKLDPAKGVLELSPRRSAEADAGK